MTVENIQNAVARWHNIWIADPYASVSRDGMLDRTPRPRTVTDQELSDATYPTRPVLWIYR